MEMTTRALANNNRQSEMRNDAASLIEILAAIAIGVFSMFLVELGNELNNPIFYWCGIIGSISAVGYITVKFIHSLLDLIKDFKKKDNHNTSK